MEIPKKYPIEANNDKRILVQTQTKKYHLSLMGKKNTKK